MFDRRPGILRTGLDRQPPPAATSPSPGQPQGELRLDHPNIRGPRYYR